MSRNLEVIELGTGTWTGWEGPNEAAPLPQYPQPSDLPDDRRIRRMALRDTVVIGGAASLLLAAGAAIGGAL